MEAGTAVRLGILGPVAVRDDAGVVSALTPQLRGLAALLAVADGSTVSADRIAEYLADGAVDGSIVRTAVSRLRKALGDRVQTSSPTSRGRLLR